MKINVKLLSDKAILPTKGSMGAAGYDLYATDSYNLAPGERKLFPTNVSMIIPEGYYGRIAPRSGLAYKKGIDVLAGVIDSDYRGDIGVILINLGNEVFPVNAGDRMAQLIIEQYHDIAFDVVDELIETDRGAFGYGSTGK